MNSDFSFSPQIGQKLPRPGKIPDGIASLEQRTLEGIELHFKHLIGAWGDAFPIRELKLADLQGFVNRRSKAKGKAGRGLSPATIKKEIVTLRTAWNWGVKMGLVAGRYPNGGLRFGKVDEKPPFMTREEIGCVTKRRVCYLSKPASGEVSSQADLPASRGDSPRSVTKLRNMIR